MVWGIFYGPNSEAKTLVTIYEAVSFSKIRIRWVGTSTGTDPDPRPTPYSYNMDHTVGIWQIIRMSLFFYLLMF